MSLYREIYDAEPIHRIKLIRDRFRRSQLRTLARDLGLQEATLVADLGLKLGKGELVPQVESERLIGLMSLIGRVEKIVAINGPSDFDAAKWLGSWLDAPLPALGGVRPGSYLDTVVGQDLLGNLIAISESGAYA